MCRTCCTTSHDIVLSRKPNNGGGITSVCSPHPPVLEAAIFAQAAIHAVREAAKPRRMNAFSQQPATAAQHETEKCEIAIGRE
jgi:tagatose-1,6-bisphosphate aldolase non-catalytic subunit AgaZ/GatZ